MFFSMVNSLIVFRVGSKRQKPSRLPLLAPIGVGSEGKRLSKGVYSMRIRNIFCAGFGVGEKWWAASGLCVFSGVGWALIFCSA
jgi:hypothetical protein